MKLQKMSHFALVDLALQHRDDKLRQLSLEHILADICEVFDQPVELVKGKSRKEEYVLCRKIYSYIAREKTKEISVAIGDFIGHKDHSTVLYNADKIRGYLKVKDPIFMRVWTRYLNNSKLFTPSSFEKTEKVIVLPEKPKEEREPPKVKSVRQAGLSQHEQFIERLLNTNI